MKIRFGYINNKKTIIIFLFFCYTISSFSQIIDGYTNKQSYRAGETISFYVSGINTSGNYNQIPLLSVGGAPVYDQNGIMVKIPGFDNMTIQNPAPTNLEPWKNGFNYINPVNWQVPTWLKSGLYLLGSPYTGYVPVIIKGSLSSDIVIVYPTNTINAYTNSGGKSLYETTIDFCNGYTSWSNPCNDNLRANTVSFLRPQNFNNALGSGFLNWIYPNSTYSVSLIADIDLEDYSEIAQAKLVIIAGHSEYWARQARKNFDSFIDSGKNGLILSGNTMWWQVRYEDENYVQDNTKLTCYKDVPAVNPSCTCPFPVYPTDLICDPLLKTTYWNDPQLKLSIIGSIGSDVSFGGYGDNVGNYCGYDGFDGFKIISPTSPLFDNVGSIGSGSGELSDGVINFADHEIDGTIIKNLDANNNNDIIGGGWSPNQSGNFPILDVAALGFHRAEIIAYERTKLPNVFTNGKYNYAAIMAFQKTCNSGKIINVNSSSWCSSYGIGGYAENNACGVSINPDEETIRTMTDNMIKYLIQNSNIFTTQVPNEFLITPAVSNVSYTTCLNGSTTITPCGVSLVDGYKIDNKNGAVVKIESCESCNSSAKINDDEKLLNRFYSINQKIIISPNPNKGIFNITLVNIPSGGIIQITDLSGKTIYNEFIKQNEIEINIQDKPIGVYVVKIISGNQIFTDKLLKQ